MAALGGAWEEVKAQDSTRIHSRFTNRSASRNKLPEQLLIIQKQLRFVPDGPGNVSTARVHPEQLKKIHKTL
ncbi:unnamed protein product [Caenorhabditis nigoni]